MSTDLRTGTGKRCKTGNGNREIGERETGDGRRETGDGKRVTGNGKKITLPVTRYPISVSRFPISDFRFPISDFRLPISDFRFPTSDFRFPISDRMGHYNERPVGSGALLQLAIAQLPRRSSAVECNHPIKLALS